MKPTNSLNPNVTKDHTFSILDHIDKLTAAKEKGKYFCPACNGHNLSIDQESGAYTCWNGCECKDIREALAPWSEIAGQGKGTHPIRRKATKQKAPAPIPEGDIQLAKLPSPAMDIPQKQRRQDSLRGEVWVIQYPYSETQWVERTEWLDPTSNKGHEKIIIPYHVNSLSKAIKGKGDRPWAIYREDEAQRFGTGKWVTFPEGEKIVECCRWLGLVGITPQGGSWTDSDLYNAMLRLKKSGVMGVVYLPDHDETGRKKAEQVAAVAASSEMPCLIIEPLAIWEDMPHRGDIADWVKWGKEQGMNHDDFIQQLERAFHAAAAARIDEQKLNDPNERLKLELQELLSTDDPIKRMRRRAEIASYYRLNKAEIDEALKELRQRNTTPKPTFFSLGDFLTQSEEALDYIVPSMLPVGETVLLVAVPKAGKTLLAIDLAFAVATGESDFLGERCKRGRVLIVSVDESASSTRSKLIKRGFRPEDSEWVQVMTRFDISQMSVLEERLELFRPSLVIIDSLRRINHGQNVSENSAEFADTIYTLKETLTRYNAAGVLIHHTNKDREATGVNRVRGSSAISGAAWGVWQLDHILKPDPNNKKRLRVDPKDPNRTFSVIARDAEGQSLKVELDPENHHWISHGEGNEQSAAESMTMRQRIQSVLEINNHREGLTVAELRELLGLDPGDRSIHTILSRMVDKREVWVHPSTTDRRRLIYSLPKSGGDSPSPLPSPTAVEYCAEPLTQQELQDTQQIVNTYSTLTQHPSVEHPVLSDQNLDCVSDLEIVNTPVQLEGGVLSAFINPQPFKEGERVQYTGIKFQHLYFDLPLTIHSVNSVWGVADCRTPDGNITTWLPFEDLRRLQT